MSMVTIPVWTLNKQTKKQDETKQIMQENSQDRNMVFLTLLAIFPLIARLTEAFVSILVIYTGGSI